MNKPEPFAVRDLGAHLQICALRLEADIALMLLVLTAAVAIFKALLAGCRMG